VRFGDPAGRVAGRVLAVTIGILVFVHVLESYFVDTGPPHLMWTLLGLAVAATAGVARGPSLRPPLLAARAEDAR
jgi:hypothetical protein